MDNGNNGNMDKGTIVKPALIGGVALGILSVIPILSAVNMCCCAWAIGGGILAASIYIKDAPTRVTLGQGALVGLAAGIIGAVVCGLFSIPLQFIAGAGGSNEEFMRYIQESMAQNPEMAPEIRQKMEEFFQRTDLMTIIGIIGFFLNLIFFALFALIGGAIGTAIFEKRKPGQDMPNMPN